MVDLGRPAAETARWVFGEFELDATRFELSRAGQRVVIQRKPLQLLIYLCRHGDRFVPAGELLREVWRDVAVTEASLRGAVKVLRRTIAGSAVIDSARGFGYRFHPIESALAELSVELDEARQSQPRLRGSHSEAPRSVRRPKQAFVGRGAELEVLTSALEEALQGNANPVLLVGPAGIGKTRLTREFSELAQARGMRPVFGQCWEGQGAPPFWPWGPVLEQLAAGERGTPLEIDAAPTRFRLFADVVSLLHRRAEQEPLLLVVEDIHWAQETALLLLKFVVEQLQRSRLLVVATYRDLDVDVPEACARLVGALEGRSKLLPLQPLGQADVTALLESESTVEITRELANKVLQWSGGNPLFVRELVPLLDAQGAGAFSNFTPPAGVREAIRAQLGPLHIQGRDLLATCALIGDDFELSLLAKVWGSTGDEVQHVLRNAVSRRVVTQTDSTRYRFAHALFREVLTADLAVVDRAALHLRIARALEEIDGGSETHVAAIAFHFAQALPSLPSTELPTQFALAAARAAMKQLAYEQARDHCLEALALIDRAGSSITERAEVLIQLGEAQRYCGATEQAKRTFMKLVELGRNVVDPELVAIGARGYGYTHFENGQVDQTLRALLEEALEGLPVCDSPLRAEMMAQLGRALQFDHDFERRHATSLEAVEIARRTGDSRTLVTALAERCQVMWGAHDLEIRRAWPSTIEEAIRGAEESESFEQLARVRALEVACCLENGSSSEALASFDRLSKLAHRLQHPTMLYFVEVSRAAFALLEGNLKDAEHLTDAALDVGASVGGLARRFHNVQQIILHKETGDSSVLLPTIRDMVALGNHPLSRRSALASVLADAGQLEGAAAELEQLAAAGLERYFYEPNWLFWFVLAGRAAAATGSDAIARGIYEALRPYGEYVGVCGSVCAVGGSVALTLGQLARRMKEPRKALEHLEAAVRLARGLNAAPEQARCEFELACVQLEEGRLGKAALAARTAHVIASELGMKKLSLEAKNLRSSIERPS